MKPWIPILLSAALLLFASTWSVRTIRDHEASVVAAEAAFVRTANQARQVFGWQGTRPVHEARKQPFLDMISRIESALDQASLSQGTLAEIQPGSEGAAAGVGDLIEQTVLVRFEEVGLSDLGQFLATWRESEPAWRVAGLGLDRSARTPLLATRFDVRLRLSTYHL